MGTLVTFSKNVWFTAFFSERFYYKNIGRFLTTPPLFQETLRSLRDAFSGDAVVAAVLMSLVS